MLKVQKILAFTNVQGCEGASTVFRIQYSEFHRNILENCPHCPKNLHIKTENVMAGADNQNRICPAFAYIQNQTYSYRISFHLLHRDRPGFYSEVQIIFGTVCI